MVKINKKQPSSRFWQGAQRFYKTLSKLTTGQSGPSAQAGITLVELIVVIAIFSLVSSVLIFNYSDFKTNVSIRNLSQDIALTIRKAQTYATSVRGIENTNLNTKTYPAYGLSFSLDDSGGTYQPSSKKFILFADIPDENGLPPNKSYETEGSCGNLRAESECVEAFSINSGDSIVKICSNLGCEIKYVDITFRRPTPDAIFCVKSSFNGECYTDSPSNIEIIVQSAKGLQRSVSVWNTGQIGIK